MKDFDLRRKNWLVPFLRFTIERFADRKAETCCDALGSESAFGTWLEETLHVRGFLAGAPTRVWDEPTNEPRRRAEWMFLNTLTHQVELILELCSQQDAALRSVSTRLTTLMIIAAHCGELKAAEQLYDLLDEDWGESEEDAKRKRLAKLTGPAVRAVGARLKEQYLHEWDHPLLGLPFHHILNYAETRQLLTIAYHHLSGAGRIDEEKVGTMRAHGHMLKLHLIDAVLALAYADKRISKVERRLVEKIIDLAKLNSSESKLIWASVDEPVGPDTIAKRIQDSLTRELLFAQIVVDSFLEDAIDNSERTFIDKLATAFGYTEEQRIALEADALTTLERHPGLVTAFKLNAALRRMHNSVSSKIEHVLKLNLGRIVTEIRETGELAQLLMHRTQGKLSPEEEQKVRAQLFDICKTIPALAVFAVPGGTVLLPILLKLLPFDLMPTAFSEGDEAL